MSNPLNPLQAGLYNRLNGYSPLMSLLKGQGIYDFLPQNTSPPYVVIGDDTAVDADTKTGNGWDCTITIHCWDYVVAGRKSVKNIMDQIFDALHRQETQIAVAGFSLTYINCDFQQSFQDTSEQGDSDHFYHGVQRFRALISDITS